MFEHASGVTVQTVSRLDQLTSRGVRGAFTAADALSQLVEGTGLAPRVTAASRCLRITTRWIAPTSSTRRTSLSRAAWAASRTCCSPASKRVGYTRFDAAAFYRIKDSTLSLGMTNPFDTRYYPTANGDNNISPGAPRTLQLSLRHVF